MENTALGIGCIDFGPDKHSSESARRINDGIEAACMELVERIEQRKGTATDKELIDLCMALAGMVTAWNLASMRANIGCI